MAALDEALDFVEKTGERAWEPEFHRLYGVLKLEGEPRNEKAAETYFTTAVKIAGTQKMKSFELRAATSLARLWQAQDKRHEAHDLLAPVYNWFTEGFDTADLKDAKALLDELK